MQRDRQALFFIFITLLIDVIGIGLIIPVLPGLIQSLTGEGLSYASKIGGWLMFSYAAMQFIAAPVLGGLSDKFGRRPVLLFSLLGLGIDYVFQALAPALGWLFLGRLIAGVFGGSFTTATAYIADISTPGKRSQNFGLIGTAFGIGFIIGPVLGGVVGDYFGTRAPFVLAAILSFVNVTYGYFVLPESHPQKNRSDFQWRKANPLSSLLYLRKYPLVISMLSIIFLLHLAAHAVQSNWTYYTMFKFDWSEATVGYSLGLVGILVASVQGGLIRVLIPRTGNAKAVFMGLSLNIMSLILFGFATQGWMMLAILIPYALGGVTSPAVQGIMSNEVPVHEQGKLHGAATSVMSITSIIGPLMMNNIFSYFSQDNPIIVFSGMAFLVAAVLSSSALVIAVKKLKGK